MLDGNDNGQENNIKHSNDNIQSSNLDPSNETIVSCFQNDSNRSNIQNDSNTSNNEPSNSLACSSKTSGSGARVAKSTGARAKSLVPGSSSSPVRSSPRVLFLEDSW